LRVLDGTEAPEISVFPSSLSETLTQGLTSEQTLAIANNGDAALDYELSIDNVTGGTLSGNILMSNAIINDRGFKSKKFKSEGGIGALLQMTDQRANMTTSLYATDFEDFTLGEINNQLGWQSQFAGNFVISNQNALNGSQHFRSVSDGLGGTRPAAVLALSPTVTGAAEAITVASADISITGSGVSWEFIPQAPSEGSVITRVRFNGDGTISILSNDTGGFVNIATPTPTGYFNIKVTADSQDNTFRVFFDGVEIFSATGFAAAVEQVVVLTGMETTGSTFDMDNVEITDGDGESLFISASPLAGTVGIGDTAFVEVKFDARGLDTGIYTADLTVTSNDTTSGTVVVPASLTVVTPPSIAVSPDSLVAAVDVQVTDPAIVTETLVISNSGDTPLEFTTSLGETIVSFNSSVRVSDPQTDLRDYGLGFQGKADESSVEAVRPQSSFEGSEGGSNSPNATGFSDSIAYDSGIDFPTDFSGVQTSAYTTGMRFEVTQPSFNLTAVRNAYQTEAVTNPSIILEIYAGGANPTDGTLLLSQTIEVASAAGIFLLTELNTALPFAQGDVFWIVHRYPNGIAFPQGVDDNATQRANTYFFSGDGGATFNPSGFVFLTRALSGDAGGNYLSLSPAEGTVNPGDSLEITVTFDGETLGNGTYDTDIVIASNDPNNSTVAVPTEFTVSGQVAEIAVSDQFLLFNSVFVGADKELEFTIFNEGLGILDVPSISSDNPDFTVTPDSTVIGPSDSVVVTVTYTPSGIGNSNGIISILSSDTDEPLSLVIVAGVGTEPPVITLVPEEVIDTTNAGTTLLTSIDIRNDGNFPLIWSIPEIAAASALADPEFVPNNTTRIVYESFSTEKTATDNRVGFPVINSVGSDLGFGYTWIDSDEAGGPVYNFTDITGTGNDITTTLGGDGSIEVSLPFVFEFYGNPQGTIWINANGFLSFEEPSGFTFSNNQIPDDANTNNLIAGFWDDLEPQNFDGSVHFEALTDRFIVQWTNASKFFGSDESEVTFQIVLMDDGNIDIFYEDVEAAAFLTSGTVGIENADGTDGAQVAFNTAYVKDNLALRFIKPAFALTPFISDATPTSGVVPAGGVNAVNVTLDATNLNDGQYFDELVVTSNDPVNPSVTGLFNLTVIGFPEIAVSDDTLTFAPIFIGLESSQTLTVTNTGSKTLEISSITSFNPDFSLSDSGPASILPGGSIDVEVVFAPSVAGPIADLITISSDDAFGNDFLTVNLFGTGVEPPVVSVDPDSVNAVVFETETLTDTLIISNTGGSTLTYSLKTPVFSSAQGLAVQGQYEYIDYPEITDKETGDTRVGPPMINASGGPGTFGYSWVDNNSGGLPFDFTDISTTGTLANVGNDGNEQVALPFTFDFFGESNDSVFIAANGFLSFAELVGINFINSQIPNTANPNAVIAGLWDDLEPADGGGVFYQTIDDKFIVQYENVPGFGFGTIPAPVTFQIILFSDGTIQFQYENVESTIATSSTVGVEGPLGELGLQIIFNTPFLENGQSITVSAPVTGSIAPGDSDLIEYTLDATTHEPGNYEDSFVISSNDPATPELVVPVSLEVLNLPDVVTFSLIDADLDVVISELKDGDVINLDNYPTNSFNIVANTNPETVGSVIFDFNGQARFKRENGLPYAIAGDRRNGTDFNSFELPLGENTVTATAFTDRNGRGKSGTPLTVNFTVINTNGEVCYGEEVVSYLPGNRKNGIELPAIRTDASNALGAPNENDTYNFASLGFGGSIEIRLACEVQDMTGNDLLIVETSFRDAGLGCEDYPETARVEASQDGTNWVVIAEEICRDGEVDLANGGISSAQYIRITDTSNEADFRSGNADGYDVDGIVVINNMIGDTTTAATTQKFTSLPNIVANEDAVISTYPNPVIDELSIALDNEEDETVRINIYSFSGAVVYSNSLEVKAGVDSERVNVANLPKGIYQMTITDSQSNVLSTRKVLKR
ncbi:MAG: choice-of-anchor D domain-containing protein, partial [Cyclobacteriaceae bacterium]